MDSSHFGIMKFVFWSSGSLGLLMTDHDLLPHFMTVCSKFSQTQETLGSSKVGRVNRTRETQRQNLQ